MDFYYCTSKSYEFKVQDVKVIIKQILSTPKKYNMTLESKLDDGEKLKYTITIDEDSGYMDELDIVCSNCVLDLETFCSCVGLDEILDLFEVSR